MSKKTRKKQYKKLGIPYMSERQAFDLMSYQARFILSGLRTFRNMRRVGLAPNDIAEAAYKVHGLTMESPYTGNKEAADAACKDAREKWDAILDKMIYAFGEVALNYPDSPADAWIGRVSRELEEAGIPPYKKRIKNPDGSITHEGSNVPPMPSDVKEASKAYQERIRDGLRLYAEYFQDLWD